MHHLDLSNVLDCFLNVERGEVFPKFALLQLGIIQDVIDEEAQNLRTRSPDLARLLIVIQNGNQFLLHLHWPNWRSGIKSADETAQSSVDLVLFDVEGRDGVD